MPSSKSPPAYCSVTMFTTCTVVPGATPRCRFSYTSYTVGRFGCRPLTASIVSTSSLINEALCLLPLLAMDFTARGFKCSAVALLGITRSVHSRTLP